MQIDGNDAKASRSIDIAGSSGTVSTAPPRPGCCNFSRLICPFLGERLSTVRILPKQKSLSAIFGIEFHHDDHTYAHAISTYEFSRCFGLVENIQYPLSHDRHKFGLDAAMSGRTSSWIFDQTHSHLVYLCNANSEIFLPNQFSAPTATIQTLVNGAIRTRLPSRER
jgi:hypothetical protein